MSTPPKIMRRDEFIEFLATKNTVPRLIDNLSRDDKPPEPGEFRVSLSGLHPPTSEAWVFDDGLCMVCPALFDMLKQALAAST